MMKGFFLAWWYHKAQADIRQFDVRPGTMYFVVGVPLYMFRNLAVCTMKWILTIHSSRRYSNKIAVWAKCGEIRECYNR